MHKHALKTALKRQNHLVFLSLQSSKNMTRSGIQSTILSSTQNTFYSTMAGIVGSSRNFSSVATPALVKELRALTGSPLKDCMAALTETGGDLEASKDILRKKGLAQAEKKMERVAAEGLVAVRQDDQGSGRKVTMVQVACETDFVAKTEQFRNGVKAVLDALYLNSDVQVTGQACSDPDFIAKLQADVKLTQSLDPAVPTQTIQEALKYTISKT